MNIGLLNENRLERNEKCYSFSRKRGVRGSLQAFRRGVVWLGKNIWESSIVTFTAAAACCTVIVKSSSSTHFSYHRLHHVKSATDFFMNLDLCIDFDTNSSDSSSESAVPTEQRSTSKRFGDDTVLVKVGIVGDCQTGKTSLMSNYVAGESIEQVAGVSSMEKVLDIQNAKIAMSIWDLGEYIQLRNMAPLVCKDAAAILIVFDLTRRATLHSVKQWFLVARKCNKVAVPVLVGTKYDQFVKMPEDIKAIITKQARLYAQAMGAPLLFTSTPYNINVHKVFKIALARLFDLPCNITKNLNPGQPLVEY